MLRYGIVHIEVHGVVGLDAEQLLEGLHDEDDGDQRGEAFLSEPGDVLDEGTQVEDHDEEYEPGGPETDPYTRRHEVPTIIPME